MRRKLHKVSSRAKLAPVLYGDPVLRAFKCEDEGAYLAYVTDIRDTQKGRKVRPSLRLVVEVRGVEPRSNRPLAVISTCLSDV